MWLPRASSASGALELDLLWEAPMAYSADVIVKDPDILGGMPVFRGTRVPFKKLVDYLEDGHTVDEFLGDFHSVTREAAIAALEHARELVIAHASAVKTNGREIDPNMTRSLERAWLNQHHAGYAGAWVALEGSKLVAHGSTARHVLDAAQAEGYPQPLIVHIPSEPPLPFGGW